jgi:hypothetical protein
MSEYIVTYTEVSPTRSDDKTHRGLLIHIRPPVQLNPDAVERYLTYGAFVPVDRSWENLDVKDVVLLGSTPEQTTIYASIDKGFEGNVLSEQVANDTVRLLQFMGATAIIDNPSAPDA